MQSQTSHAKLRLAGVFIMLGLIVQALSLLWNHPLSFIAFVAIGGFLVALGIVVYLLTVLNTATGSVPGGDRQSNTY